MRRSPRVVLAAAAAALLAVLAGGVGLGVDQYPRLRDHRDGVDLEPGLLQVDDVARGDVALGDGVYVVLGPGGITISRRAAIVWRSVDRGALVTAGLGTLRWRGADVGGAGVLRAHEDVDRVLANVRVTGRTKVSNTSGSRVTYTGRIFAGADADGPQSRPLTVTVTRRTQDSRVVLDVDVPSADVVAIHEFRRPGFVYRGFGEQFARSGVRDGRWPVVTRAQGIGRGEQPLTLTQDLAEPAARGGDAATTPAPMPFYLSSALSGVGVDSTAYAVVDLSHGGRVDTSVWAPSARFRLYDAATPSALLQQHTADVGRMRAAPAWSTSGAVVGVRGGSAQVLQAVQRLLGEGAVLSAVLVRDGGDRRAYPDWDDLVGRLQALGVRTMASVSPGLSPTQRPGGPDDEPALYALARSRGWLVRAPGGEPAQVATGGVAGVGSVPGALVDLTDPAAVDWYAGVLAERLRDDGLAGWVAPGGFELPMDAQVARGTPATEHNRWPRRWAELTDEACRRGGVPDCLVLHDSADERTAAWARGFVQAEQVTGWSQQDGLASVVPARLSAGLSGLTHVSSGVGGWSSPPVPVVGGPRRTDELLSRWAELEAFGPLLRSEDGDRPADLPQVHDSPARRAAFVRATRLFAATAAYRRQAMAAAEATGVPVVRPFWLENTDARQAGADQEYFFGASLLVVPVVTEGQRSVRAVLPAGRWVELFSGRSYAGPPEAAAEPAPTRTGEGPVPQPPDVPAPPGTDPDATEPPDPIAVDVPAPLGQPVVLYRADDAAGRELRRALADAGLLR
ncbi:MAG TPA: TIM-barrel domain-containing protein [Actinomycetales bacterium]